MTSSSYDAVLSALGDLVINWNFAEMWIRIILVSFIGNNKVADILTLELGAVGIENALNAVASEVSSGEEQDRLGHCASLYCRLRGYRNYYVHGMVFAAAYLDSQPSAGFTFVQSAKGKLKIHSARVEAIQIREVGKACRTLGLYARQIVQHRGFYLTEGSAAPPLPEKPPLPPPVDKNAPWPKLIG
jgi:hypothetical protein